MDEFTALSNTDRARLRQEFIQEAGEAFDRMFDPAVQDQLVTLRQREDKALGLGHQLTTKLLEEHLQGDRQVRPTSASAACCPKCKREGHRITKAQARLPDRVVTTRAGDITLHREKWECRKCRIIFFSVRPSAATGDGGV